MRFSASSLAAALVLAGPAPAARDPPRIVPWHEIGNVGIGMSHRRVERMYGSALNGNPPRYTIEWKYRGRGVISVVYDEHGYVDGLSTTSPAYATPSGMRVGMHTPVGRRHWRGFTHVVTDVYDNGLHHDHEWDRTATYGRGPVRVAVQLFVDRRGVVTGMWLGRYLHCPWGDADVPSCKRPPPPPVPPPPAGMRYCEKPGGPGNFLAASPSVTCAEARKVEMTVFSPQCVTGSGCDAAGFVCVSSSSFRRTAHALCRDGVRRIEMDEG